SRLETRWVGLVERQRRRRELPAVAVLGDEVRRRLRIAVGERARGLDDPIDDRAAPELVDRSQGHLPPVAFALALRVVLLAEESEHVLARGPLGRDEDVHRLERDLG